jgi:hypothetical protein
LSSTCTFYTENGGALCVDEFKINEFHGIEVDLWIMKCDCAQWLFVGAKIKSAPTVDADSSLVV